MIERGSILCVGRVYCDLIFTGVPRLPSMGTEIYADALDLHAGGGAFITAAHLSALGRPTALAAILPKAPFDAIIRSAVTEAGINTSLCEQAMSSDDPQVTVALVGAQDRAFVTRRSGAATPSLTKDSIRGACHLHIGELATLAEAPWLLTMAQQAGLTVSLDCAWEDSLTASVAPLISQVDLFLPNEDEAAQLHALNVPMPWAPCTIVKQGANGATITKGDQVVHAPSRPITPVDTTGAGDAFNAGFLNAWLSGHVPEDCLNAGHDQAALSISTTGGFSSPAPAHALGG